MTAQDRNTNHRPDSMLCREELALLHQIAELMINPTYRVDDLRDWIDERYPYFIETYKVARLMNPRKGNVTRSALVASRVRSERDAARLSREPSW